MVSHGDQFAKDYEILRTTVGSQVHGIAIEGTDDHDEMGIYIEPPEYVLGIRRSQGTYVWRTQPEGHRSGPGDTDLVLHSLRKYLSLAAKGNPTALLPLWAPQKDVLFMNEHGRSLRVRREWFMSQEAVKRFLGYMHAQHERMMGLGKQNRVPNRPELVARYGYDVKYASHAVRLAYEGLEIAQHGTLTLPVPEPHRGLILDVKQGKFKRSTVSDIVTTLTQSVHRLIDEGHTPLPQRANMDAINTFSIETHRQYWEARNL